MNGKDENMNRVILMGRLTRDPDVRYTQGEKSMAIARYTLAVIGEERRKVTRTSKRLILSIVLHLTGRRSLRKSISTRECGCWYPAGFKQGAM